MKKISVVLCFFLLVTGNFDASAQRRGGTNPRPIHQAGAKLSETESYELYEYLTYNGAFCKATGVAVSLVLKVKADYIVTDNDAYKNRFEKEILPIIKQRCSSVSQVSIFNYVKGVILDRNDEERGYDTPPDYERPLAVIQVFLDQQGKIRYEPISAPKSLAMLRQKRELQEKRTAEATAAATAAEAAKQRIANTEYSSDGKLKLTSVDPEHKN